MRTLIPRAAAADATPGHQAQASGAGARTCDPATGEPLEQALEATAEDVDAAVRAANRAYWDHVAEVFGRRCSANWTT